MFTHWWVLCTTLACSVRHKVLLIAWNAAAYGAKRISVGTLNKTDKVGGWLLHDREREREREREPGCFVRTQLPKFNVKNKIYSPEPRLVISHLNSNSSTTEKEEEDEQQLGQVFWSNSAVTRNRIWGLQTRFELGHESVTRLGDFCEWLVKIVKQKYPNYWVTFLGQNNSGNC